MGCHAVCIQSVLNDWFFHPLGYLTKHLSDRMRTNLAAISTFFLAVLTMLFSSSIMSVRYLIIFVPSCFFLGLIILAGIRPNMQPATFDKFGLICWLVITVFIGINGLFVNSDDLSEFVLWAFALPVTFLVWGNKPEQLF